VAILSLVSVARVVVVLTLAVFQPAFAQAPDDSAPHSGEPAQTFLDEFLQVRGRAAVAFRSGSQTETSTSPSLSYSGSTFNDVALRGWWWFAFAEKLGASVELQRESFALFADADRVTGGGLVRGHAALTARFRFGPVRLEPLAGYAYQQVPRFGTASTPSFSLAERNAFLLGAAARLDLGPVTVEARGEYPIALGNSALTGFGVQAALRVQLFRVGDVHFGVLGEFTYQSDTLKMTDGPQSTQSVYRAGLGVDVALRKAVAARPVAVRKLGELKMRIVDELGKPLSAVSVRLTGAVNMTLSSDENGLAQTEAVPLEMLDASLTLTGYQPANQRIEVQSGLNEVQVAMPKEKPKVGALAIKVIDSQTQRPLSKAAIKFGTQSSESDTNGLVRFEQQPVGNVSFSVTLSGYKPAQEAAQVIADKQSEVTVALTQLQVRLPAAIKGQVRTLNGGTPLQADLEIPQLKIKIKADAAGSFSVPVPGGTYTVRISARGFVTQTKSVVVREGDSTIFNVDLTPK
jgi:hypothetical protein